MKTNKNHHFVYNKLKEIYYVLGNVDIENVNIKLYDVIDSFSTPEEAIYYSEKYDTVRAVIFKKLTSFVDELYLIALNDFMKSETFSFTGKFSFVSLSSPNLEWCNFEKQEHQILNGYFIGYQLMENQFTQYKENVGNVFIKVIDDYYLKLEWRNQ